MTYTLIPIIAILILWAINIRTRRIKARYETIKKMFLFSYAYGMSDKTFINMMVRRGYSVNEIKAAIPSLKNVK